jgi:hypothetical protein
MCGGAPVEGEEEGRREERENIFGVLLLTSKSVETLSTVSTLTSLVLMCSGLATYRGRDAQ